MNRELKTLVVSVLLVFFLAGYNFLIYGTFFFTFPINDYLLLIVAAYYSWCNFRKQPWIWLTAIGFAVFNLLGLHFNLELFLNIDQLMQYQKSDWPERFQWIAWANYAMLFTLYYKAIQPNARLVRMIILYVPLAAALLCEYYPLVHLSPLILVIDMAFHKQREVKGYNPLYYLIILLNVLNITKAIYLDF